MMESKRNIIITGGASGIGKEITIQALMAGEFFDTVVAIDRDDYGLRESFVPADRICNLKQGTKRLEKLILISADVGSERSMSQAKTGIPHGMPVDVLINCAGENYLEWIDRMDMRRYDQIQDSNAKALLLTYRLFSKELKDNKGLIINILSDAARKPMTCSAAYNASKAAAEILTREMARELTRAFGITVIGVSPNKCHSTEMSRYVDTVVPVIRDWTREFADEYARGNRLRPEETDPADLAELIVWLAAKRNRTEYLTGSILEAGV